MQTNIDYKSPLERILRKGFEEMSARELKKIRIICSLFFASACIILGLLFDYFTNKKIEFVKYILIWIWLFLGWYILMPIVSRSKIGRPTKKIKIFFLIVGFLAISGSFLRFLLLLGLYTQKSPLVSLWVIIANFIVLLFLTIGLVYVWKKDY